MYWRYLFMVTEGTKEMQSEYWLIEGEELWSKSDKTVKSAIEALSYIEKSINLNPLNYKAWTDKGFLLRHMGDLESSLLCLDRAIALKKDYVTSWYNKGVVLGLLGRYNESENCYLEVLRLEPNNKFAKRDLEVLKKLANP